MRINKFVAQATGLSRRAADLAIEQGRITVNGTPPSAGYAVTDRDIVLLDRRRLQAPQAAITIMLNKPAGYVVSRNGQGSKTIYDLLPPNMHRLKPIGRLDKDSSGLLLLTTDGQLAERLTHPKYQKRKVYRVRLDKPLTTRDQTHISGSGVHLAEGVSRLTLSQLGNADHWQVTMHEGRNRQIRRTFAALGYTVTELHRTDFGTCALGKLAPSEYRVIETQELDI